MPASGRLCLTSIRPGEIDQEEGGEDHARRGPSYDKHPACPGGREMEEIRRGRLRDGHE